MMLEHTMQVLADTYAGVEPAIFAHLHTLCQIRTTLSVRQTHTHSIRMVYHLPATALCMQMCMFTPVLDQGAWGPDRFPVAHVLTRIIKNCHTFGHVQHFDRQFCKGQL